MRSMIRVTKKRAKFSVTKQELRKALDERNAPNDAPRRSVEDVESGLSVDDRCGFGGEALGE